MKRREGAFHSRDFKSPIATSNYLRVRDPLLDKKRFECLQEVSFQLLPAPDTAAIAVDNNYIAGDHGGKAVSVSGPDGR